MQNLRVRKVRTVENDKETKITVVIENEEGKNIGFASLFVEKGYSIEKRFENTINLLIKPVKKA